MSEPTCPNCKEPMPADAEVCSRCGEKGAPQHTPDQVEGEQGLFYCYRHKRETTRLRCGRCGRAICTECAVIGPAGPRCPDCGRSRMPLSARGAAHEAKMAVRNLVRGPGRFIGLIIVISLFFFMVRGCRATQHRQPPEEPRFEEQTDPGESSE